MAYTIGDKNLIDMLRGPSFNTYISEKMTDILSSLKRNSARTPENPSLIQAIESSFSKVQHPLDVDVQSALNLKIDEDSGMISDSQIGQLNSLWNMLIKKSIICLRYFDTREPFIDNDLKQPAAYGVGKLKEYYSKYEQFEGLLYGANEHYRDHVFHALRTWMLGVYCLLNEKDGEYLIDKIQIDGAKETDFPNPLNILEKLSIWTLSALCHDLGYPLEKSQQILDKTRQMMCEFIPNPNITSNFTFAGTQDHINEYILKFMSTKMKTKDEDSNIYFGRIQPKYYLKYSKSLEKYNHGIISAVLIFKMLLFFVEADFNLNDDYVYEKEDAKQFYVRREILRAIASHTCNDVYNMNMTTFSSLLYMCDELQEWGRKSWNDIYMGVLPKSVELTIHTFTAEAVNVSETIDIKSTGTTQILLSTIRSVYDRQYNSYKVIFRDGQYTNTRNFTLEKKITIMGKAQDGQNVNPQIIFSIQANGKNTFQVDLNDAKLLMDEIQKEATVDAGNAYIFNFVP